MSSRPTEFDLNSDNVACISAALALRVAGPSVPRAAVMSWRRLQGPVRGAQKMQPSVGLQKLADFAAFAGRLKLRHQQFHCSEAVACACRKSDRAAESDEALAAACAGHRRGVVGVVEELST